MKLPDMKYSDGIRKTKQLKFGGLDMSAGAKDGALCAMENMTGDHYPLLASRSPRALYKTLAEPYGLFSWKGLCWVDGTTFYFRGQAKGEVEQGEKTFSSLGPYIVIFPDKCYYNMDTDTFGQLESKWTAERHKMVVFDAEDAQSEKGNRIMVTTNHWDSYFTAGDAVEISGCTAKPENNGTYIIRKIEGNYLYFDENVFALNDNELKDGDGTARNAVAEMEGTVIIHRKVPDLLYVCENDNRLWGCTERTIYACALGNVFHWAVYDGLETDAYTVDTGSAGNFTGCISYQGYPTFFKEEQIYKVYGTMPSNYEVLGSAALGLQEGCHNSLAVAGGILYYLGRSGVMAYSGGFPQSMADAFGTKRFRNAVGGSDGLKYYVSMEDESGERSLYVYDTQRGLWHREDNSAALQFARWDGNLYMLRQDGDIWIVGNTKDVPEKVTAEDAVPWFAEFADFTEEDPNQKGIGKIQVRLELDPGATAQVKIMYDSDGVWHNAGGQLHSDVKRSYYLPVLPRRCDHYRLRIDGVGICRIHSLVRETYSGSEYGNKRGRY